MKREDLANEIRGAGHGLRYADSPVIHIRLVKSSRPADHSPKSKLKAADWDIIRMAATCSECDATASTFDIEFAESVADCYRSFARLIWPTIEHEEFCNAEPYLPVYEGAQKNFAKVKAEFERLKQQHEKGRAAQKAKSNPKKAVKKPNAVKKAKSFKAKKTRRKKKP